jgi:hypothetical protein
VGEPKILATAVGSAAVSFQHWGLLGSMPSLRARTCRSGRVEGLDIIALE